MSGIALPYGADPIISVTTTPSNEGRARDKSTTALALVVSMPCVHIIITPDSSALRQATLTWSHLDRVTTSFTAVGK